VTSQFGPFTRDLILTLVPEPGVLWLVVLAEWALFRAGAEYA